MEGKEQKEKAGLEKILCLGLLVRWVIFLGGRDEDAAWDPGLGRGEGCFFFFA